MTKIVRNLKYILYSLCLISFIFYPGKHTILTIFTQEPSAFMPKEGVLFNMRPLPYVDDTIQIPYTSALSYLVIDASSFTPVLWKQEHTPRLPASTVKMATALVAYQNYPLEKQLTVKTTIDEEVLMGLVPGDKVTALNLLYGTLVSSANDAAYTLAENDPLGVDAFVSKMNTLAKSLNMKDTHFTNPIGFDNAKQISTAFDLALLAQRFSNVPLLMNIVSTRQITPSNTTYTRWYPLTNINQLVGTVPGVGGIKTGYTDDAGENLVTYYRAQGTHPFIIVVLGSEDRFGDTQLLLQYLNENLRFHTI